jgi:signal transduction histidine kinase
MPQTPEQPLPSGDPHENDRYRLQVLAITIVILLQVLLIAWLVHERRYRRRAEKAARETMLKLTQLNMQSMAGELSAAGHRTSDVVASVRAMFKKDAQDKTSIDINKTIWSVLGLVYIDLRKYSIEIRTNLSEHLRPVIGNEVQLQQVVLNLVMNAIESMHSADQRVLSIASEPTGHDRVHVSIQDTGSGIEPTNVDDIFKPLFTTKAGGMGMGLAICRSIIESHAGRLWVSAGASRGSVFQFELPTSADLRERSASEPESASARA